MITHDDIPLLTLQESSLIIFENSLDHENSAKRICLIHNGQLQCIKVISCLNSPFHCQNTINDRLGVYIHEATVAFRRPTVTPYIHVSQGWGYH